MEIIKNYSQLKNEFGWCASFAIWEIEGNTPTSNTEDLSVLTDENIMNLAKTDFVFVGLNAAVHDLGKTIEPWSSFHSADHKRQKDHKLRYTFKDTKYWGCYITDIIKGVPETDSNKVKKHMKANPQKYEKQLETFRYEMKLLAGDKKPILVAMGDAAYQMLYPLFEEFKVIKIPHYAARGQYSNRKNYSKLVLDILKNQQ